MNTLSNIKAIALTALIGLSTLFVGPVRAADISDAGVVEIVTFNLKDSVTAEAFAALDRAVEEQHVTKQPGFVARHAAAGEDGTWLVVVYWENADAADASMAGFMDAPAAAEFVAGLDADSMAMTRYDLIGH